MSELDEARFAGLLDAYGADPKRWPDGEREAAQRFIASNAKARHLLVQARELDLALASSTAPTISAALERRLLSDFDRVQQRWSPRKSIASVIQIVWPGAPLWQPAAVFGLALAFGIGLAILAPLDPRPSEDGSASVFTLDATPDSDAGQDI